MTYARIRFMMYVLACVLCIVLFFLALFHIVTKAEIVDALPILSLVFAGITGLAAKNTPA